MRGIATSSRFTFSLASTFLASTCLLSIAFVSACQPSGSGVKLDQALAKLDQIERRLQRIERVAQAAPPRQQRKRARPDPNTVYHVPVADTDPYVGAEHAKVTIVEASEFACPYCASVSPMMQKLVERHGDDVKVVSKSLLIHPQIATQSALAACAAHQQGAYAKFEKALWQKSWNIDGNRPALNRDALSKESLTALAGELDLDLARFESDMATDTCTQAPARHRKEMNAIGISGTPNFFINGRHYQGARAYEAMEAAVLAEKAKAEKILGQGVGIANLYGQIIADGKRRL